MTVSVDLIPPAPLAKTDTKVGFSRATLCAAIGLMLMRVAYMGSVDLFPEEAYYWNYAKHLALGYLDHPPMVSWLIHLGTSIFGNGEFGVRFFAAISSIVTTLFAYLLTEFFYGRRAGVTAALLVQVLPFFFITGLMMAPDGSLTACWAGMLYCLARAIFDRTARAWWGLGVCLGLGMLSKYTIALLGPATILFLALDPLSRPWFRRATPYGAVLLAALIFSPVIVWNGSHHWASFAFQTTGRTAAPVSFSFHHLAGSVLFLLTPVGVMVVWRLLRGRVESIDESRNPLVDQARILLFARVFTLVPLAVFVFFSLQHRVKLNWTGPLWLAVLPLLAAELSRILADRSSLLRRVWIATVAILAVGYLALLHHLAFGIPGLGYSAQTELLPVGWPELGRALSLQKEALRQTTPGKMLVVGIDRNFIASEAAFYQKDQEEAVRETTGVHLFGGISLMYSRWFPAKDQDGATLLIVSFVKKDLNKKILIEHFQSVGRIQGHWIQRGDIKIRRYYTRVGYNYRSAGIQ